jgi:Ca2+-binding RTX toxin-like protein
VAKGPSSSRHPHLLASQPDVRFTSVVTTGDALPGGGVFGGIPDGIGAFDNGNGTITVLVNHELSPTAGIVRDHGGLGAYIDRLVINKATLEIVASDDAIQQVFLWNAATDSYTQTANVAFNRFCSGDLADAGAFFDSGTGLGTSSRIYLTGEEAGAEGRATATIVSGPDAGKLYELAFLGNLSFENVVANGYEQAKTIVAGTDDAAGGQVYIYVGNKQASGSEVEKSGLVGGDLYGIKVDGLLDENTANPANGTFTLAKLGDSIYGDVEDMTGAQLELESDADGITGFDRPEDLSWDPENPNVAYFVTTNAFDAPSRLYKLTFSDITNPAAGGTIEVVAETNPATNGGHMFDNITVDNGKVIIQEDPGNNPYIARVWEYDTLNGSLTELGHFNPDEFVSGAPNFITQDEESSGAIDVTDLLGDSDTRAYLLDAQVHKTTGNAATVEQGQLIVMYVDDPTPSGTRQADFLRGNSNSQAISANNGDDTVWAFGGNDTVSGGNGVDILHGGSGNDTLNGDNGDDVLFGDLGNDILSGGRGADYFVFNNTNFGSGTDTITDFANADRILTTSELASTGGVVDFGADHDLDLFDGGSVTINGGAVDHLVVLGTVQFDGATYYSYGLAG